MLTFFLLAFGITWIVWVPRAAGVSLGALGQLWTWIPAVAALLAGPHRRAGCGEGAGARLVRWRVGWHWYLVVVFDLTVFSLAVAGIYALLGGSWTDAVPSALREGSYVLLPLSLTDGLGEELAWRGFALPRLLAGHNALVASLIPGVFWRFGTSRWCGRRALHSTNSPSGCSSLT